MQRIRSIFISDVHLGCKYTHADSLLAFLKNHQPQYLYIVGDFVDGWRLRKSWYWNDTYTFLFKRIVDMMKRGTRVFYTPGNHDEFLREFIENLGSVQLADEFIHVTADRRKLLVMHGDQFDACVVHAKWLSHLGDAGYNLLLGINVVFNAVRRRLGFGYWSLSQAIKRRVKQATCYIGNFEEFVTRHAAERGCAGVICGHIHTPKILDVDGIAYYNTGDWVESCTALVEYADGTMELLYRPLNAAETDVADERQEASPLAAATLGRIRGIPVISPQFGHTPFGFAPFGYAPFGNTQRGKLSWGNEESAFVDAPNSG